jgi:hypothetical protein
MVPNVGSDKCSDKCSDQNEGSERIGSETIPIKGSDNIFDLTLPD